MFENSIVCQCTYFLFLCAWLCVDWSVGWRACWWFVGWCVPVRCWNTHLFEYCLVFRLHWWIGWHVIVFNFCLLLVFAPSGLGEAVIFLCSNFWTPARACFCVVCGGVFFWLGLGFSRPWFWDVFVLKFYFLWRVWSWLRTNAGGVLNTCKSNAEAWCLHWVDEWRTGE